MTSVPGVLLGALCFIGALTPSLVPRAGLTQGALAGASFAVGYGIGALASLGWRLLRLPEVGAELHGRLLRAALLLGLVGMGWALWRAPDWQDALHLAMGLPPVETVRPFTIAGVSLVVAWLLIQIGRLFYHAILAIAARLSPIMPERLALLMGFVIAVIGFNFIGNDLIVGQALRAFDASYRAIDKRLPTDDAPPSEAWKTGSPASLIDWNGIGAAGRERVADPLDAATIATIAGAPAQEPLRIYVGLGSGEDPAARADLALREAIRVGAFDRDTLVIATPTGTGWIDPASMLPLEVLTRGDVATISVQYSYLPSWLALLTEPSYGVDTARAVFAAIHGHWRKLPPNSGRSSICSASASGRSIPIGRRISST